MAKVKKTKKRKWRLKKQVRKTLGCLFMISALIVTAIPVQPMEAAPGGPAGWVEEIDPPNNDWSQSNNWVYSNTTTIPTIADGAPVYRDQTGNFRFVYVDRSGNYTGSDMNKLAIIVGFQAQELPGGNLQIPLVMDAYMRFTDGATGTEAYAAANKLGKPLYYKKTKTVTRNVPGNDPVLTIDDLNGNGIFDDYVTYADDQQVEEFEAFRPCTPNEESIWSPGGTDVELYYYDTASGIPSNEALGKDEKEDTNWTLISGDRDNRIREAPVRFIGNQYAGTDGQIHKSTSKHSVFGGSEEGVA